MTMRLLQESYDALGRYLDALRAGAPESADAEEAQRARSEELRRVNDLRMRLEPALATGAGEVVCPACSRVYHQHPADAEANSRAESCGDCLAENGAPRAVALLTGRPPCLVNASPIVLTICCECRTNATSGDAGEVGTLACSGCWGRIHREEGGTPMTHPNPGVPNLTGGEWGYEPGEPGHSGSREEPPEPSTPPTAYSIVLDDDGAEHCVPLAVLEDPAFRVEPDPDDEFDDGVRVCGDPDENARLFSLIPRNLRAMRSALASLQDGDPQEAARALRAALHESLGSPDSVPEPGISAVTRREPATREHTQLVFAGGASLSCSVSRQSPPSPTPATGTTAAAACTSVLGPRARRVRWPASSSTRT